MNQNDDTLSEIGAEIISSAVPGAGPIIKRAADAVRREWARNTSTALRAAERVSGMMREEIADQLDQDPRLIPLYVKVVYAAGMNGHDSTLRAMGGTFGGAVRAARDGRDDELTDADDALSAMRDFGPRHFAVMADLSALRTDDTSAAGSPPWNDYTPRKIASRIGIPTPIVSKCLLNLAAAGVIAEAERVFIGTAYVVTDLGFAVMAAVELTYPA